MPEINQYPVKRRDASLAPQPETHSVKKTRNFSYFVLWEMCSWSTPNLKSIGPKLEDTVVKIQNAKNHA